MAFCINCGKELNKSKICNCKGTDSIKGTDINDADSSAILIESKKVYTIFQKF